MENSIREKKFKMWNLLKKIQRQSIQIQNVGRLMEKINKFKHREIVEKKNLFRTGKKVNIKIKIIKTF